MTFDTSPMSEIENVLETRFKDLDPGTPPKDKRGRFIAGPPRPPFMDSEIARAAIQRRWTLAEEAAQRGMMSAVEKQGLKVASASQAWEKVMEVRTQGALKKGKAGTQDALLIGRATGFLENRSSLDVRRVNVELNDLGAIVSLMELRFPGDPQRALEEAAAYRENPMGWVQNNVKS